MLTFTLFSILQVGTGVLSQRAKLGRFSSPSLKGHSWCGTAATLSTCWPFQWRPAVGPPACASSTTEAASGWTPRRLSCLSYKLSQTFRASSSTTPPQARRRRTWSPSGPKPSRTQCSARLKTAAFLLSSCVRCTTCSRVFLLCSTWHASPSTNTQTAPTSCPSQSRCCASCRTTLSSYEDGSPVDAEGQRYRNMPGIPIHDCGCGAVLDPASDSLEHRERRQRWPKYKTPQHYFT